MRSADIFPWNFARLCFADYPNTSAMVYVVDSNDRDRIHEAREELGRMCAEAELGPSVPLLVFANKQDLPNAMSLSEITSKLGLLNLRGRDWHIQSSGKDHFACPGRSNPPSLNHHSGVVRRLTRSRDCVALSPAQWRPPATGCLTAST